jgi:hypothetical protein
MSTLTAMELAPMIRQAMKDQSYVNHANPKRRIAAIRARPRPDVQSTPRENQ